MHLYIYIYRFNYIILYYNIFIFNNKLVIHDRKQNGWLTTVNQIISQSIYTKYVLFYLNF